jgi:hypothetical protein
MKRFLPALALPLFLAAAPVGAQEIFGGVYAHDVDTPFNLRGETGGIDIQAGFRGPGIPDLGLIGSPSPYVFAALNTGGDVHYAAAGLSWKIGGPVYLRPGIGLAVHTGSDRIDPLHPRRSFGSRVLFEPELGLGFRASKQLSVEASWVHMSHAQLFSQQNPGIDNIGVRLNYRFR